VGIFPGTVEVGLVSFSTAPPGVSGSGP